MVQVRVSGGSTLPLPGLGPVGSEDPVCTLRSGSGPSSKALSSPQTRSKAVSQRELAVSRSMPQETTFPPRSSAEAHGGLGGDSRQPAWLHHGQVLPDQPGGLLWWCDGVSGEGKNDGCDLSGLL